MGRLPEGGRHVQRELHRVRGVEDCPLPEIIGAVEQTSCNVQEDWKKAVCSAKNRSVESARRQLGEIRSVQVRASWEDLPHRTVKAELRRDLNKNNSH